MVKVPSSKDELLVKFPQDSGVYAIHDKNDDIQFIGISKNIAASVFAHSKFVPDLCSSVKVQPESMLGSHSPFSLPLHPTKTSSSSADHSQSTKSFTSQQLHLLQRRRPFSSSFSPYLPEIRSQYFSRHWWTISIIILTKTTPLRACDRSGVVAGVASWPKWHRGTVVEPSGTVKQRLECGDEEEGATCSFKKLSD
ncbi:hypothetical protein LINPERPRIM_LOCUS6480 [Linum perenne]